MSEISQEFIEQIVSKTAEATAEKLYCKIRAERTQEKETLFDKRLYNTKLLLEHYRLFKEHAENAQFEIESISNDDMTAIEILDSMLQSSTSKGDIAVESIRNSALRTKIVMAHIDEMLGIYESYCYRSTKPENERRWDVINTVFIKDIPQGIAKMELYEQLAEKHFVSIRQVQIDINTGLESLTALFFGIDGVRRREKRKKNNE